MTNGRTPARVAARLDMLFNQKQLYTPALAAYEFNEKALVVDTETVGAGPTVEIIEIALADINGQVVFESLVRPAFNPLPPPSKHGRFDKAELTNAPGWAEVWPALAPLLERRLLVAYNAAFDRRALAATRARHAQPAVERGWRCAMSLVKSVIGAKRAPTLSDACAYYGLEGGNHRAACDALATVQLLKAVVAQLPRAAIL